MVRTACTKSGPDMPCTKQNCRHYGGYSDYDPNASGLAQALDTQIRCSFSHEASGLLSPASHLISLAEAKACGTAASSSVPEPREPDLLPDSV